MFITQAGHEERIAALLLPPLWASVDQPRSGTVWQAGGHKQVQISRSRDDARACLVEVALRFEPPLVKCRRLSCSLLELFGKHKHGYHPRLAQEGSGLCPPITEGYCSACVKSKRGHQASNHLYLCLPACVLCLILSDFLLCHV